MSDRISAAKAPLQRIIGLTGGVGMGKTTLSNYLADVHHIPVLDADVLARDAVQPNSPVLHRIVERYGDCLLLPNGQLDRFRLGEIVFNSSAERLWVEQQIHPYVRDQMQTGLRTLAEQGQLTAVLVVPLLFEARMTDLVTEIWVVRCTPAQQVERLMQREIQTEYGPRFLSEDQARARIHSQMAIEKKTQRADVIIDNSSTLAALYAQIDAALEQPAIAHKAADQHPLPLHDD